MSESNPFSPGDVVYLVSEPDILMTVDELDGDDRVIVVWFDANLHLQRQSLSVEALVCNDCEELETRDDDDELEDEEDDDFDARAADRVIASRRPTRRSIFDGFDEEAVAEISKLIDEESD